MKCPNCNYSLDKDNLRTILKEKKVMRVKGIKILNRWTYIMDRQSFLEKELITNSKHMEELMEVVRELK